MLSWWFQQLLQMGTTPLLSSEEEMVSEELRARFKVTQPQERSLEFPTQGIFLFLCWAGVPGQEHPLNPGYQKIEKSGGRDSYI